MRLELPLSPREGAPGTKKALTPRQKAERSLQVTYRRKLWTPFMNAIKQYGLIAEGDRIAVCISGGKDSMLLAKLMQQLQRISNFPFEVVYLVMDPGYNPLNRQKIEQNAALLGIPVTIFESSIFNVVAGEEKSPCYLCARMRRGHLYAEAQRLGCNKIALGHHFSDVIETTLLGLFYGAKIETMVPMLRSRNFPGMELIRPLYMVHEDDIIAWKNFNDLEFIQCACRFTEDCALCGGGGGATKRQEVKALIKRLKRENPAVEQHIFKAMHMVNLDTVLGFRLDGAEHGFLEEYRRKGAKNEQDGEE